MFQRSMVRFTGHYLSSRAEIHCPNAVAGGRAAGNAGVAVCKQGQPREIPAVRKVDHINIPGLIIHDS